MSVQWARDEAKLGFSGPPSEIGWADHEEIVGELKDALKDIEALANEALDDTPPAVAANTDYGHLRRKLTKIWERAKGAR